MRAGPPTPDRQGAAAAGRLSTRQAGPDDLDAVRSVSAAAYAAAYLAVTGDVPRPGVEDHAPRIARGEFWLLEEVGGGAVAVVVGVAALEPRADHLLVYSVAVVPGRWREGLGRRLLALAEERAAALGLPELRLYTNARMARNLAMYARAGFRETGRRAHPSRPDEMLVDMVKRLGAR